MEVSIIADNYVGCHEANRNVFSVFAADFRHDEKICNRLSNLGEKCRSVGVASDGSGRTFKAAFADKFKTFHDERLR